MQLQTDYICIRQGTRQAGTPGLGVSLAGSSLPWSKPKLPLYSLVALAGADADQTSPTVSEALHAEFARNQHRSVTSALREALRAAEDTLRHENSRSLPQHRCAGSLCAATLRGDMVYVAFAGAAVVYAWQAGALRRLGGPDADVGGLLALDECEIGLGNCRLGPGECLLLSSSGLLSFTSEESLAGVLARYSGRGLLDRLEGLHLASAAADDFTLLLLSPESADLPMPSRAAEPETPPPERPRVQPSRQPEPETRRQPTQPSRLAPVKTRATPAADAGHRSALAALGGVLSRGKGQDKPAPARRSLEKAGEPLRPIVAAAASRVSLTPQVRAIGAQKPASLSSGGLQRSVRASLVTILLRFAAAALVLALVFAALYFGEGMWHARDQEARSNQLVSVLKQKERDALAAADPATRRWLLTEAVRYADQGLSAGVANPEATAVATRLRAKLDEINAVVRLPALQLLADFSAQDRASQPSGLLAVGDDLYVLDRGAGSVWQLSIGKDMGTIAAPHAVWRKDDSLEGTTLSSAMAMFWMYGGAPGLPEQVYALDNNGVLVRCGKDNPSQPMRLPASAALPQVRSAVGQTGNLYVLDTQRRLVWRYLPGGNGYDRPPQEYLTEVSAPGLGSAVDMAGDGSLYLLYADGQIGRFTGGQPQAFSAVVPDTPLRKPTGIFASPTTKYLYVADAGNARVVKFSKDGRYVSQYVAPNGAFDDLRAAFVDEQRGRLYTIAGTRTFISQLPLDSQP